MKMPSVAEMRSAVTKTRERFSYMTDQQLRTRLNRITKVAKLMAFLQVAQEEGVLSRWLRPVRQRAESLGMSWNTIGGRYEVVDPQDRLAEVRTPVAEAAPPVTAEQIDRQLLRPLRGLGVNVVRTTQDWNRAEVTQFSCARCDRRILTVGMENTLIRDRRWGALLAQVRNRFRRHQQDGRCESAERARRDADHGWHGLPDDVERPWEKDGKEPVRLVRFRKSEKK
jgi:hypothetical protein